MDCNLIETCRLCVKVIHDHDDWIHYALPSIDGRLAVTCCGDHVSGGCLNISISAL